MTEIIRGKLEVVNWTLGSGSCSVGVTGQVRDFYGNQRMVGRILEEDLVSIGDAVILTVDDVGLMTSIRRAPVCPKCGSLDVEEEKVNGCLVWQEVCAACGWSWLEE